jgi:aspartyl aminopeptidase
MHILVGFLIIGGHTDSPNFEICGSNRVPNALAVEPYQVLVLVSYRLGVGVECYGGGLWRTWFDRDLGLSGRVLVRTGDGKIAQRLVKIDRALLRISSFWRRPKNARLLTLTRKII